jgi:hypothetical protein
MKTEALITVTHNGVASTIIAGSIHHGEQLKVEFEKVGCTVTSPIPKPADYSRSEEETKRVWELLDLLG